MNVELKPPEAKLRPPSVEFDFNLPSTKKDFELVKPHIKEREAVKLNPPEVESPSGMTKKSKLQLPKVEIPLHFPEKETGDKTKIDVPEGKGGKQIPSISVTAPKLDFDLSLSEGNKGLGKDIKVKAKDGDEDRPKLKMAKMSLPNFGSSKHDVEESLPKEKAATGVSVTGHGDVEKIKLPAIKFPALDISINKPDIDLHLPKGIGASETEAKGEMHTEYHDNKSSLDFKLKMPKISIPKFGGKANAKGSGADISISAPSADVKGTKMPTVDVSLPKVKLSNVQMDIERDVGKDGKFKMPTVDVSLPKVKSPEVDIDIEGPSGKPGKFKMPTFDVSLPKMKLPDIEVDVEGDAGKDGKFQMPTVDVSLPKVKSPEVDIDIEGPSGKPGKFKMPTFDVSLPKMKLPDVEVDVEGDDGRDVKFKMPSIDVSLPKSPEVDIDIEGPSGKPGKFKMPTFDVSLPKMKLPDVEVDVEGDDGRDVKFKMPSIDVSLPKVKLPNVQMDVEGDAGKDGKFKIPTIDVSLPKVKSPEVDVDIEGLVDKPGMFKMPTFDVSLPKLKSPEADIDVEGPAGKPGKFKIPTIDVSLPKVKSPEVDIDIEGPSGKPGKFKMPTFDVSLPKVKSPEADTDVEGPAHKPGKFKMPTVDVSLPKVKSPEVDIDIEGPSGKPGKFKMPTFDVSLPKMKLPDIEVDVEGDAGKDRKFKMPTIDVSLPKVKSPEVDIDIEGPSGKPGKFKMPTFDISLPKRKLPDVEVEVESDAGKDGKFKMPSIDVSLPKVKSSDVDVDIERPASKPGKFKMPTMEVHTENLGSQKGTFKLDLDFGFSKGKGDDREEIELLKAEGGRPSSGSSFDVPDVSLQMPKFFLPKFGNKSKSVDLDEAGGIKISPSYEEHETSIPETGEVKSKVKLPKVKMPGFGLSKTDGEVTVDGAEVDPKEKKGKAEIKTSENSLHVHGDKTKYKLKIPIPKFSMLKLGSKESGLDASGASIECDSKTKVKMPSVEISLPASKEPEGEVLLPKTEVDVSEADIKGYEGNLKIPKLPTIGISAPKISLGVGFPSEKYDVSFDSGGKQYSDSDGDFEGHANIDSSEIKFKLPKMKIPKVDLSVPKGSPEVNDTPQVEMEEDGTFTLPKLKMPKVDILIPKAKMENNDALDTEIDGEGKNKMPKIKIPKVDISLSKGNEDDVETSIPTSRVEAGEGEGKFKLPSFSLPKISAPEFDLELTMEKPNCDGGIKKQKQKHEVASPDTEAEHPKIKMKMPTLDIHVPKRDADGGKEKLENPAASGAKEKVKGAHIKDTKFKIEVPKLKVGENVEPNAEKKNTGKYEEKGSQFKMKKTKFTKQPPGLPEHEGQGMDRKFQIPKITLPDVEFSVSKGGSTDMPDPQLQDTETKLPKFRIPELEISGPTIQRYGEDKSGGMGPVAENADGDMESKNKIKIPKFGVALPTITPPNATVMLKASDVKPEESKAPEITSVSSEPKVRYEGPKMPKVKKAVFVLVNPKMDTSDTLASSSGERSTEAADSKVKVPKIKMKASFGKSNSKGKGAAPVNGHEDGEEWKVKTGGKQSTKDENESREDKSRFGKLKIPKVEFSSPYSKLSGGEEEAEITMKLMKKECAGDERESKIKLKVPNVTFSSFTKKEDEKTEPVVSSRARTEMLKERQGSESPTPKL
ncbi:neuroblast differentiation-associated protein AHNAK-like [Arapaima gigas]